MIPSSAHDAVLVSYARTPFGRARKGSLATERPEDLARHALMSALASAAALPVSELEDFYLGTAAPEGAQGDNMPRRVAVLEGIDSLPGVTLNRFCASSLEAAACAARAIRAGDGHAYLVGGAESTSIQPPATTNPYPGSDLAAARADRIFSSGAEWRDPREESATPDIYVSMGKTAEFVARSTGTSRREQDEWALQSQLRSAAARDSGFVAGEISPYRRLDGTVVSEDDGVRPGTTMAALEALPTAFLEGGTVTAGNASPLNDGATAAVLMSAQRADDLGIVPIARVLGATATGLSPEIMGLGPIAASERLLSRLGLTIQDIDIVELNEAFAAQVVPVVRALGVDPDRVNPRGGAIAVGHPFGATGVRLVGTLARGLVESNGTLGLATLCVGGGQGMALALERLS